MSWRREVDLATGPENGVHTSTSAGGLFAELPRRGVLGSSTHTKGPGGNRSFTASASIAIGGRAAPLAQRLHLLHITACTSLEAASLAPTAWPPSLMP